MIVIISHLDRYENNYHNLDFLMDTPFEIKNLFADGTTDILPETFYQLFQKYPKYRDYLIIFIIYFHIYLETGSTECSEPMIGYLYIFKTYIKESDKNNLELIKETLFDIIIQSLEIIEIKEYFNENRIQNPTVEQTDSKSNNKILTEFPNAKDLLNDLTKKCIFSNTDYKKIINYLVDTYDLSYLFSIDKKSLNENQEISLEKYIKAIEEIRAQRQTQKNKNNESKIISPKKEYFNTIYNEIMQIYKNETKSN